MGSPRLLTYSCPKPQEEQALSSSLFSKAELLSHLIFRDFIAIVSLVDVFSWEACLSAYNLHAHQ